LRHEYLRNKKSAKKSSITIAKQALTAWNLLGASSMIGRYSSQARNNYLFYRRTDAALY
jgi:hypothetical protein